MTWANCEAFITKLNELTGETFRLPTEAEWEFAARGGNLSKGYQYSGSNDIDEVVWYALNCQNSEGYLETHPVASKKANELGLYDMTGNVNEFCQDWYSATYYSESPLVNPQGPTSGTDHVMRGGSGRQASTYSTVAYRYAVSNEDIPYKGFRLALTVAE